MLGRQSRDPLRDVGDDVSSCVIRLMHFKRVCVPACTAAYPAAGVSSCGTAARASPAHAEALGAPHGTRARRLIARAQQLLDMVTGLRNASVRPVTEMDDRLALVRAANRDAFGLVFQYFRGQWEAILGRFGPAGAGALLEQVPPRTLPLPCCSRAWLPPPRSSACRCLWVWRAAALPLSTAAPARRRQRMRRRSGRPCRAPHTSRSQPLRTLLCIVPDPDPNPICTCTRAAPSPRRWRCRRPRRSWRRRAASLTARAARRAWARAWLRACATASSAACRRAPRPGGVRGVPPTCLARVRLARGTQGLGPGMGQKRAVAAMPCRHLGVNRA